MAGWRLRVPTSWQWGKTGQPVAVMEHIPMHISTSAPSVSLHHILGFLAPLTQQTFDRTLKGCVYESFCERDDILIHKVFSVYEMA